MIQVRENIELTLSLTYLMNSTIASDRMEHEQGEKELNIYTKKL